RLREPGADVEDLDEIRVAPLVREDAIQRAQRVGVAGRLLEQLAQLLDRLLRLVQLLLEDRRALGVEPAPLDRVRRQLQLAREDLGQLAERAAGEVQLRQRL